MSMGKALNELKTFVDLHEQAHRDANEERINVAMDHTINSQLEEFPVDASAETKQAMDQILSDRGSETLQTHEATLASSAMLVEVNISNWVGRKKDKRASQDVTAQNNAITQSVDSGYAYLKALVAPYLPKSISRHANTENTVVDIVGYLPQSNGLIGYFDWLLERGGMMVGRRTYIKNMSKNAALRAFSSRVSVPGPEDCSVC